MRVLVTGGLGFIGSEVARQHVARGDQVVIIDDLSGNVVDDVPGTDVHAGREWDLANVSSTAVLDVVDHCDRIIHAASPVGAVGVIHHQGWIVSKIVAATDTAARVAMATGAKLVNISSSEVYGFPGRYRETDSVVIPAGATARREYAVGKLAGEYLVAGRATDVPAVNIRPFNVVGPGQPAAKGFVLPTFCEQAHAGRPLTVFRPGSQERAFTAVWDVARFIVDHVDAADWTGEVVNVGNPDNMISVLGLANLVLAYAGVGHANQRLVEMTTGREVWGDGFNEADGTTKLPDPTRALGMGWVPKVGLRELVERTYAEVSERAVGV